MSTRTFKFNSHTNNNTSLPIRPRSKHSGNRFGLGGRTLLPLMVTTVLVNPPQVSKSLCTGTSPSVFQCPWLRGGHAGNLLIASRRATCSRSLESKSNWRYSLNTLFIWAWQVWTKSNEMHEIKKFSVLKSTGSNVLLKSDSAFLIV